MKSTTNLILLVILIFNSILIASCTNKLSRSKAKEEILKKYQLPYSEELKLEKIYIKSYASSYPGAWLPHACLVQGPRFDKEKNWLEKLKNKNLITITENGPLGQCKVIQAVINLTEEGNKYLINSSNDTWIVKKADISFGDITGIQIMKQYGTAEAHYTLITSPSPFDLNNSNRATNKIAHYSLFDDGWRLLK
jgi:hypothetical protein